MIAGVTVPASDAVAMTSSDPVQMEVRYDET